jgi:hypothetical protein
VHYNISKSLKIKLLTNRGRRRIKKFDQSDCCFQTEDNGQAMIAIATSIRNVAHVPVQSQKGWNHNNVFGGWFSSLGGFKTLVSRCPGVTGNMPPSLLPLPLLMC